MFNLYLINATRVLLITMISLNALASSTAFAQARQESVFNNNSNTQVMLQGNRTFDNANSSVTFMENVGQFDPQALFVARGSNTNIYLAQNEIWFSLLEKTKENPRDDRYRNHTQELKKVKAVNLKLVFPGSNPESKLEPFNKLEVNVSQFLGNDSTEQFVDVPVWGGVRYVELYPGADLEITSENGELVWNIIVKDSAKFASSESYIRSHGLSIKIAGQKRLSLTNGKVNVHTDLGDFFLPQMLVKGLADEKVFNLTPKEVGDEIFLMYPGTLSSDSENDGSFAFVSYAPKQNHLSTQIQAQTLESPNLLIAMLLGGGSDDIGYGQAAGPDGSMFVTGRTQSIDFPTMAGYDEELSGNSDAFVAKINNSGVLEYATYLGGGDWESADSIAVNQNGEAYVVGTTHSDDFPFTPDAISANPQQSFLSKLNANGNALLYSSYIGNGSTNLISTAIDADENVFMLDNNGTAYKLVLGNSTYDYVYSLGNGHWYGIAVSESGNAYFAGETDTSPNDVLVTSVTSTGQPVYPPMSFGGNSWDRGFGIAVDSSGFAYVTGSTFSTNFPVVGSPVTVKGSVDDAFVTIIDPNGSITFSSYLDLGGYDYGKGIAVDSEDSIYVIGETDSPDFPSTSGAVWDSGAIQGDNVFVVKLRPNIPLESYDITYATEIGGSEMEFTDVDTGTIDTYGNVYVTGYTISPDFVGTSGFSGDSWEAFAVKISTDNCIGTTLSPIGQAVLAEVGPQEYCGNYYDSDDGDGTIGLIALPPGQAAFERFRILAETAITPGPHEIDFVTMTWDSDEQPGTEGGPDTIDSAGDFFLQGIQTLYDDVHQNPQKYAGGVRVRILLGLKYYSIQTTLAGIRDQRVSVMNDLEDMGIPLVDTNWTVEVANYRNAEQEILPDPGSDLSGIHSHVKMMIVDGKHVITGGYNMQYIYLDPNPYHDMGAQVSGPIAYRALKVFDGLWSEAYRCDVFAGFQCVWGSRTESLEEGIPHNNPLSVLAPVGNDAVFSLYRDHIDKTADNAIGAAIRAANSEVNILQQRFMNYSLFNPPLYASAVLDALKKGDGQVHVNLLVSGSAPDKQLSIPGICLLRVQLLADPFGTHHLNAYFADKIHTKALSIDNSFVIVGSQNFDSSAWGEDEENDDLLQLDLAEYSLGIDSDGAATAFNTTFTTELGNSSPATCFDNTTNSTMQSVIDQAAPGTTVFIPRGVYRESLIINKPLVLVGAGANQTILKPEGNEPAFRVTSSDVEIMSMRISAGAGYGIELIDSSPSSLKNILINRVVFENNAQGGVLAQGLISGSPMNYTIENNTFIGGADGIAINMIGTQADTSFIRNNIFSGQSNAPIHILSTNDSRVEYSYNLFDDCGLGACATYWRQGNMNSASGEHNNLFDLNPLFTSLGHGAYQLSTGSPVIDAGDPSLLHDLYHDGDNDGIVRIDLGAFEYVYLPVANVAPVVNAGNDQTVNLGNSATVNAIYSDVDNSENHSARIDWGDGTIEDVPVNMTGPGAGEVIGQHTYSNTGNYTVEVCVADLYGAVGCDQLSIDVISTPTSTPSPTPTLTSTPTNTPTATFTPTATPAQPNQPLYLSLNNTGAVGGAAAQDVDILSFNGSTWSMFLDGSDVGISTSGQDLNEFHILDADTLLLTFDAPITLGTLAVDPWDVVRFDATSLGDNTAGTFSMYLDGDDIELDTTNEYLDGLDVLPDGRVLISTTGNPTVSGVTGEADEDILAFTPTTLGDVTSGTWSMYFDGSDVGLADSGDEDVDALAVHTNGDIYLSTSGDFTVTGVSGFDEDVFICTPTSLGSVTACTYSTSLYFDGSTYGLDANDVDGINLTLP